MTPAPRPRKQRLRKDEWDFSDLTSTPERLQFVASCWEYQREALRLIRHPEIPPPWLSIEASKRPILSGVNALPFREKVEAAASLANPTALTLDEEIEAAIAAGAEAERKLNEPPDLPQSAAFVTSHQIEINWLHDDKEIFEEFRKWARLRRITGAPDQQGRPGAYLAELWNLSIYRLRVLEKLTVEKTLTRLQNAREYSRNRKYNSAKDQEFSRAQGNACKLIESAAGIFRKSPQLAGVAGHGRFIWARWAWRDAMSWFDGPD